jgi:hypothetical protein
VTTIVGISLLAKEPWKNGDRLLACFDCEVRGFRLNGCLLIRTARGALLAQAPRGDNGRDGLRAIHIVDDALRSEMCAAAHGAYLALGGAE